MKSKYNRFLDTSGRFRTDKNFKNTILKNCSRLRQRSTDDHYTNRNNTVQPKLNNIRRIRNYQKLNSLKENFYNTKDINNNSKDNISIDMNINNEDKKRKKDTRTNIRKAFLKDINNLESNENNENKEKDKNDSFIEVNKIKEKSIEKNDNKKYNNIGNNRNNTENHRNRLLVKKNHNIIKSETNDGIKELFIDIKENNFTKSNYKRSNSIRRIMNSLYYNSYTADKKDKNTYNSNINENNSIINKNEIDKINITHLHTHTKNQNLVFNNNNFNNENNKNEKITLNSNTNSSYIYKKKNKQFGNKHNSNNIIFNTYSTEDNSFITNNDANKEYFKKTNNENQNQNLIKVKIVYQKPSKRSQLIKENIVSNNKISINQNFNRYSRRRKLLFEKKVSEDIDAAKMNGNEKKVNENFMAPFLRYSQDKKIIFNTKDEINKKNEDDIITNDTNENNNDNYIIEFFDDIIELCNSIEERTIFDILTKNINKKYIIDYEKFIINKKINEIKDNFDYCFKYFCIIIITFYFLSKDEILYKYNSVKIHLLFIQYIYSSLCYIGYQDLNSKNIKRFFKDYHFKKKVSIIQCTTSIIKLLFDEKEEYSSLNNVLKQLMVNARTTKVEDMTKIINQTILFCFNKKTKTQSPFPYLKQRNSAINSIYNNYVSNNKEENKNDEKYPGVPYIKTSMRKKFCLVLDLDETISHSLKLSFGYYFFLRPGVINFLTELSELYEIIIFTSSPKMYADNIIDKIDEKGILISHRLYKPHVIFERGKSVKKLNLIGRDLNKIIFVDNMKSNAKYNPKNLYLIPTWTDDIYDDELFKLKNKLKYIYSSGKFNDDITKAL